MPKFKFEVVERLYRVAHVTVEADNEDTALSTVNKAVDNGEYTSLLANATIFSEDVEVERIFSDDKREQAKLKALHTADKIRAMQHRFTT